MDNGWVLISEKLQIRASIAFKKHVHKTLREWIDTGLNKKEIVKCIGGTERVSCDNYRIDRQGEPIKAPPFKRQRIAIQINNNPPDPVLRGITRSKGESGGSFSDSKPTIAQFEAEIGLEIGDETPDIVREAFYQSMIPETQYPGMQVLLHRVRVNKKGEVWVKYNEKYMDEVAEKEAKSSKAPPKPSKGAKGKAKDWAKFSKTQD